ncbi:hypothetical protein K7W42_16085 [Deinococcus sp. HMF7604]|uniref:hypothetical protein n=1 Tax=Deinococcus betulae TaxID=2873312 RepID=UPI001CC98A22|nr:hypothetical protein [Deinococcus betulae]MBZ9752371.1 hypothetical protein [Deinococcus betulae]
MSPVIASADLRPEHLPTDDQEWRVFASGFDGYTHWNSFERCADIANTTLSQYTRTGALPTDLDVLRTCLFFELRRERHSGYPPDEAGQLYAKAVQQAIREQVTR